MAMTTYSESTNTNKKPHIYTIIPVCTGNICRSPMAEVVLKKYFDDAGLSHKVHIISRAVSNEEGGNPIDSRAARVLEYNGYTVPRHSAQQITPQDMEEADLLLPMTYTHYRQLERLVPRGEVKDIEMYRACGNDDSSIKDIQKGLWDIEDPWYGMYDGFETTLYQLENNAPNIVGYVQKELQKES